MMGHMRTIWNDWDIHGLRAVGLSLAFLIASSAFLLFMAFRLSHLTGSPFTDFLYISWKDSALSLLWQLPFGYIASVFATWLATQARNAFPIAAAIFVGLNIWDDLAFMAFTAGQGVSVQPNISAVSAIIALFGILILSIHTIRQRYLRMLDW